MFMGLLGAALRSEGLVPMVNRKLKKPALPSLPTEKNQRDVSFSKVPWLLVSRLSIFVLLLVIVVLFLRVPDALVFPFVVYSFFTLAVLLVVAFDLRHAHRFLFHGALILQLATEIAVETGLLQHAGGLSSPFAILFILTILSASLVYELIGGTLAACLSSSAYIWVLWMEEGLELSPGSLILISDAYFYKAFLHICSFFLVALISGYLAQKLKSQREEAWSASLELDKVKADTDEILAHLKSGVVTIDAWGTIVYFNRAAEGILGYSEAEVRGKDCRQVFESRMPQLGEKLMQGIRFNQEGTRALLYVEDGNGKRVPLGISTSILGDKKIGIRGVVAVFQDITDALKLEERMRVADRLAAVGELSAGIAHEIRNPLASISGSVEVLKEDLSPIGENAKLLELIVKESARLNRILTDFLSYARIGPSLLTRVELIHILDDVVEISKKHSAYRDTITIRKEFSSASRHVLGEENQIKQIFLNLLVNAMEAMEGRWGEVLVTDKSVGQPDTAAVAEDDSEWLAVAVVDQGKGMNEEQKQKVFSPFFSTKKNGTGLGLAIVHRLVNNLGGKIEFRSREGRGSAFVVYLRKYVKAKAKLPDALPSVDLVNLDVCPSELQPK
jgi:two-component system sensor histidine kinase PilS (NtrC family)